MPDDGRDGIHGGGPFGPSPARRSVPVQDGGTSADPRAGAGAGAQALADAPPADAQATAVLPGIADPNAGGGRARDQDTAVHQQADPPPAVFASAAEEAPRLAEGVELVGEFADSGFKQPPFIARRAADGQIVQMPEMLFRLAEQIDGQSGYGALAETFSHAIERQVAAADVKMLVEEQLRPLGIVAAAPDQSAVHLQKVDPLLALKFRAAVIPDGTVRSLTTAFRPLFLPPIMLAVLTGLIGLDVWLFGIHGISQSLRSTLYQPAFMLMLIAGVVFATAFHEIGHATACRYGGAKPGVMGVGIYIVWPAFYTDITDAYRLGRWARLRTDVGGMYFNAIFALATAGVYFATSFTPLLLLVVLQNFAIIQQALPLLRLDGYYILSDLAGVPDIFQRLGPVLLSLVPFRKPDPRVQELKAWVRFIVTIYVIAIVAFLAMAVIGMVINLPRVLATGYDSASLHLSRVGTDFQRGATTKGVVDCVEALFLILPAIGLIYTIGRVLRRVTTTAWGWSSGHSARRLVLVTAAGAAAVIAGLSWWPNGDYRPIQPGERGTLAGLFHQIGALPTARPSLTSQRAQQLGGAPTWRERQAAARRPGGGGHATSSGSGGTVTPPGATVPAQPGGAGVQAPTGSSGSGQTQSSAPRSGTNGPSSASAAPTKSGSSGTSQPAGSSGTSGSATNGSSGTSGTSGTAGSPGSGTTPGSSSGVPGTSSTATPGPASSSSPGTTTSTTP